MPTRIHGLTNHPLHELWLGIHRRCSKPNRQEWDRYGGRGISVCDEWKTFLPFYEWAIANGYKKGLLIDRIDNDGNYEPSNCRWVDAKTSSRNRRSNIKVSIDGESMTLIEAVERYGAVAYCTVLVRYRRMGWSLMDALKTPRYEGQRK